MIMTKSKWLSLVLCLTLLLGLQMNASANRALPQTQDPRDPEIIHELITGNPVAFFLAQDQPATPLARQQSSDPRPPAWSRLAFQSFRYDNWDIYLAHPSGAGEVRLTSDTAIDSYPALAKGGQRVAFSSTRSGISEIYLQNADGSGLSPLISGLANKVYPAWSPDNSRMAFQSDAAGNYDIYVVGPGGLAQLTASASYDGEPTWSPDGTQLAFVSGRSGSKEIWVMNADGSNPRQLTTGGTAATPAWSPLGNRIAYATDYNHDGFYDVFVINPDGSNPAKLTNYTHTQQDQWSPTWSPDGKWLALVETNWIKPATTWYWNSSFVVFVEVASQYYYYPFSDGLIWKASWATTDVTPPEPCAINLRPYQGWESFFVSWSAFDAPAGISTYDVQVRDLPDGVWRDFLSDVPQTRGIYSGNQGGRYEFRCRGRDTARNVSGWETATPKSTQVEAMYPFSRISALPRYTLGSLVTLVLEGPATAGGAASYDIFVRDGEQGDWTAWRRGTTQKTATFSGTPGHTYFFRSQVHDALFNHTQIWRPDAQAMTTLYSANLTLRAGDTRGNPLPAPNFNLTPPAILETSGQSLLDKQLLVASPLRIVTSAPGFGAIPETTLNLSGEQRFAYVLPPADDQIGNGGFESGTLTGWTPSGDGASVSGTAFHTGQSAARLVPGSGGSSELTQVVTVADGLQQPTFSFLYHFIDNPGNAEFSVEIAGTTQRSLLSTQALTSGWTHVWTDLSDFAGQTVTLRFRLAGSAATIALDDISLGSWKTPLVETVTPGQWEARQTQTITITGQNFSTTPQVFLNNIALTDVEWLDAGHLQAKTPSGMLGGYYSLRVVNPDGIASLLATRILLSPMPSFLPFTAKSGPPGAQELMPSNWLTLGGDVWHSGYAPNQPPTWRYGLAWSVNLTQPIRPVVSADGILIAAPSSLWSNGRIVAYDLDSGTELWRFQSDEAGGVSPASISNGAVYFIQSLSQDSYMVCLDLYTGRTIWRSHISYALTSELPPLVVEQKVYVGSAAGLLTYDAAAGVELRFGASSSGSGGWIPSYADGKLYSWLPQILNPYNSSFFSEHDPSSGAILWTLTLPWNSNSSSFHTPPVISKRTALVADAQFLAAVNLDTRTLRWSVAGDYENTVPAVAGDVVYAINSGKLQARKISNGALIGSFSLPDIYLTSSPVITDTGIYVSGYNATGTVVTTYLLDRATLKVKWTVPSGYWLSASNGFLLIARWDGTLSVYRSQ
jgi:Tol biopolymer transport system component